MNIAEMNAEILECARYGEDEGLRALLTEGADVNFSDESGNTALHMAAANGNVSCLIILKKFNAIHKTNENGNTPTHWAAQNGQKEALKYLMEEYSDIDVLAQNEFGRSVITEAFESNNTDAIEICLTRPSSSEERLIETKINKTTDMTETTEENEITNAINHEFNFGLNVTNITIKIRELPISRADNPFGSDTSPEEDTTGLGIWPASLLTSRYVVSKADLIKDKNVLELGAGCGVPAIAAAVYCQAKTVYLSDVNIDALDNAAFNSRLNGNQISDELKSENIIEEVIIPLNNTILRVLNINWLDKSTFPNELIDVIIGSDLVYESRILSALSFALSNMLAPGMLIFNISSYFFSFFILGGSFLYMAPDENRDGMSELITTLSAIGLTLIDCSPCPQEYVSLIIKTSYLI